MRTLNRDHDIEAWRLFCRAASLGSLKRAATAENLDPSVVGRAIQALESALGAPFYDRSLRPAVLTPFGLQACERMAPVVAAYEKAMAILRMNREAVEGPVTIATHPAIGASFLPEVLIAFRRRCPKIEVEWVELTPEAEAALLEGRESRIDVACCYGPVAESHAVECHPVGDMAFVACCSPLYAARSGVPSRPLECVRHTALLLESASRPPVAELVKGSEREKLAWGGVMRFNSLVTALQTAKLGAGIIPDLPVIHFREAAAAGLLMPVMEGWERPRLPCFVVVNARSREFARVRAFADWFIEQDREFLAGRPLKRQN